MVDQAPKVKKRSPSLHSLPQLLLSKGPTYHHQDRWAQLDLLLLINVHPSLSQLKQAGLLAMERKTSNKCAQVFVTAVKRELKSASNNAPLSVVSLPLPVINFKNLRPPRKTLHPTKKILKTKAVKKRSAPICFNPIKAATLLKISSFSAKGPRSTS